MSPSSSNDNIHKDGDQDSTKEDNLEKRVRSSYPIQSEQLTHYEWRNDRESNSSFFSEDDIVKLSHEERLASGNNRSLSRESTTFLQTNGTYLSIEEDNRIEENVHYNEQHGGTSDQIAYEEQSDSIPQFTDQESSEVIVGSEIITGDQLGETIYLEDDSDAQTKANVVEAYSSYERADDGAIDSEHLLRISEVNEGDEAMELEAAPLESETDLLIRAIHTACSVADDEQLAILVEIPLIIYYIDEFCFLFAVERSRRPCRWEMRGLSSSSAAHFVLLQAGGYGP